MPNYVGTPGSAAAIYPGDTVQLFASEAPAAGQASIAVNVPPSATGDYSPLAFDVEFAAPYTAGDAIQIQGAMSDVAALYQTLNTIAAQQGYYSDLGRFKFYRAVQSVRTGAENVTVTVSR